MINAERVSVNIVIPGSVPAAKQNIFLENYRKATSSNGRLFLFAGDQKVEHLNADFFGEGISPASAHPSHLFEIASKSRVGVFATQFGLVARYGKEYPSIRYVIKLNAKTNLVPMAQHEPMSHHWVTVDQVAELAQSTGLNVVGVGMTVYLGSENESLMLAQAAQAVLQAHQHGMLAIIWVYPRGKAVKEERSAAIIAGAAGVAVCLGADFVKVNPPDAQNGHSSAELFAQAVKAAGNTKILCSGGVARDKRAFLEDIYQDIHLGGISGVAIGRNIHQRGLAEAIAFCDAIASIVSDDSDVQTAVNKLG